METGTAENDETVAAAVGSAIVGGVGVEALEAFFRSGSSGSLIATEPSALVITLVETCLLLACALKCFSRALGPPKLLGHRWHLWPSDPVCLR